MQLHWDIHYDVFKLYSCYSEGYHLVSGNKLKHISCLKEVFLKQYWKDTAKGIILFITNSKQLINPAERFILMKAFK